MLESRVVIRSIETYHSKEILSRSSNVSILGHNSYCQAEGYEDEDGLEDVCHDLAFLDIRLWYPHLGLLLSLYAVYRARCMRRRGAKGGKGERKHSSAL
jgi:hypothetical protein